MLKIPPIPDIVPDIDWPATLLITNHETSLMAQADDMPPVERTVFHYQMLASMEQGNSTTFLRSAAPEPLFAFAPPRGSEYAGRGTNNRDEAIQLVLVHLAALVFNQARSRYQLDDKRFQMQAVHALRLLEVADMYHHVDPHDPTTAPPIVYIRGELIMKLIVDIAILRVYSPPTETSSTAQLTRIIKRLGSIHQLLKDIGEPRGHAAWIKWLGAVRTWHDQVAALVLAHYVNKTETIPGATEMNRAISNGEAPSLPWAEIVNLLNKTGNAEHPLFAASLARRSRTKGMATKYYKDDTTALIDLVTTGELYHAPGFAKETPTADGMPRGDVNGDPKARRVELLGKLMPRTQHKLRFLDAAVM